MRSHDDVSQLKFQDKLSSPLLKARISPHSCSHVTFNLSIITQTLPLLPQTHTNSLTMAGRQFATFGGLAAVGAGTYYLYNAGGDPKLAQKKAERTYALMNHQGPLLTLADDAATASRKIQGELPGREKEAKKAGEEGYEAVRAKAQEYVRRQQSLDDSNTC